MNDKVLARFIDAVFVLINNVKLDNLKIIWTWVSSLRQVTTNDFNLNAALPSPAKKSATRYYTEVSTLSTDALPPVRYVAGLFPGDPFLPFVPPGLIRALALSPWPSVLFKS